MPVFDKTGDPWIRVGLASYAGLAGNSFLRRCGRQGILPGRGTVDCRADFRADDFVGAGSPAPDFYHVCSGPRARWAGISCLAPDRAVGQIYLGFCQAGWIESFSGLIDRNPASDNPVTCAGYPCSIVRGCGGAGIRESGLADRLACYPGTCLGSCPCCYLGNYPVEVAGNRCGDLCSNDSHGAVDCAAVGSASDGYSGSACSSHPCGRDENRGDRRLRYAGTANRIRCKKSWCLP